MELEQRSYFRPLAVTHVKLSTEVDHNSSRDSSVSTVTKLRDEGQVSIPFPLRPDKPWGPPSLLFNGHQGYLPSGVKRPGREADHSPPSSAEVKNAWSYTSTPTYVLTTWYLVKHRKILPFPVS
jgi:hypothetical protein